MVEPEVLTLEQRVSKLEKCVERFALAFQEVAALIERIQLELDKQEGSK